MRESEMRGPHEDDPAEIGPYRVIRLLGVGGMGRVFLGEDEAGTRVAVKVIHAHLALDAVYRKRFGREVEAARRVTGPRVAAVLAADPEAARPWLATEYFPAPSLWDAVADGGPLPPPRVRALGAALAEALTAVHAAGLVHRDVKPSNILLADDGPRLIDFGIARDAQLSTMTRSGIMLGTPQFMAPEQMRDRAGSALGPAVDVFAFGAVLGFAATGRPVFGAGETAALVYRIVHEEPDLDGIAEPLRSLIARCLAKDPGQRPEAGTLAEVLREARDPLLEFLGGAKTLPVAGEPHKQREEPENPKNPEEPQEAEAGGPVRSRRRLGVIAGATALVLTAGTVAVVEASSGGGRPPAAAGSTPRSGAAASGSSSAAASGSPSASGSTSSPAPATGVTTPAVTSPSAGSAPSGTVRAQSTTGVPPVAKKTSTGTVTQTTTISARPPASTTPPSSAPASSVAPTGPKPGMVQGMHSQVIYPGYDGDIPVYWDAQSDATAFDVHYTNDGGSHRSAKVDGITTITATSYTMTVHPGDSFCIWLRARNQYGTSDWGTTGGHCWTV